MKTNKIKTVAMITSATLAFILSIIPYMFFRSGVMLYVDFKLYCGHGWFPTLFFAVLTIILSWGHRSLMLNGTGGSPTYYTFYVDTTIGLAWH